MKHLTILRGALAALPLAAALLLAGPVLAAPTPGADVGAAQRAARVPAGDWTAQPSGTAGFLSGVSCANAAVAWAGGQNATILRTANGGRTWTRLSPGIPADEEVTDVELVGPTTGWAIGAANAIMKSADGGATWSGQSFLGFVNPPKLLALSATDASHAWIGGYDLGSSGFNSDYSIVLGTSNGTTWWSSAPMAAGDFGHGIMGLDFADASHGWAVTVDGSFTITSDGGRTWTAPLSPVGISIFSDVSFADAANGWAVGQDSSYSNGFIMHTSDGGQSWSRQAQSTLAAGPVAEVTAICAVSPNVAWAVCRSGFVLYTTDAGASWTIEQPTTQDLNDVSFASADTGWVVGSGGVILRHGAALPADTIHPVTKALAAAAVKRGKTATLRYRVNDAGPTAGAATVVIKIRNASNRVKQTLALGMQPTGKALRATFKASLPKGVYKWYVYATDGAGNRQSKVGWQTLTVK